MPIRESSNYAWLGFRPHNLISRVEGRLLLIDISSEDHWNTVGLYDDIEPLASELGDLVGWQSEQ